MSRFTKFRRIVFQLLNLVLPKYQSRLWKNLDEGIIQKEWQSNNNSLEVENFLENIIGNDFETFLEVGSSCGNKLYNIATRLNRKKFVGIDINPHAVKIGNVYCQQNSIPNLSFKELDILSKDITRFEQKFDVVFVWATLIYIHPLFIKKALKNIRYLANKKIILIEQNESQIKHWPKFLGYQIANGPNWSRNYAKILSNVFRDINSRNIQIIPLSEDIWKPGGGNGTLIIVNLSEV